jgi:hypothetical protein
MRSLLVEQVVENEFLYSTLKTYRSVPFSTLDIGFQITVKTWAFKPKLIFMRCLKQSVSRTDCRE